MVRMLPGEYCVKVVPAADDGVEAVRHGERARAGGERDDVQRDAGEAGFGVADDAVLVGIVPELAGDGALADRRNLEREIAIEDAARSGDGGAELRAGRGGVAVGTAVDLAGAGGLGEVAG